MVHGQEANQEGSLLWLVSRRPAKGKDWRGWAHQIECFGYSKIARSHLEGRENWSIPLLGFAVASVSCARGSSKGEMGSENDELTEAEGHGQPYK